MKFEWGYLFGMALQTVPEPRRVVRDLLTYAGAPHLVLWEALALLMVASTWLKVLGGILFPVDPEVMGALLSDPIMMGLAETAMAVLTVFAIHWIGRATGGTGSLGGAIVVVTWLQFVLLIVELGVLFLGVIAPGLAVILWVMGLVMTFWILTHFVTELHGFASAGRVFVGILLTLLVAVVVMSLVFAVIGVSTPQPPGAT